MASGGDRRDNTEHEAMDIDQETGGSEMKSKSAAEEKSEDSFKWVEAKLQYTYPELQKGKIQNLKVQKALQTFCTKQNMGEVDELVSSLKEEDCVRIKFKTRQDAENFPAKKRIELKVEKRSISLLVVKGAPLSVKSQSRAEKETEEKMQVSSGENENYYGHPNLDYGQYNYFQRAYPDKIEELVKKEKVNLSPKVVLTFTPADENTDVGCVEKAKREFTMLIQSTVTNLRQEKITFSKAQRQVTRKAFRDIQKRFRRVILDETEEGCTLIGPPEEVVCVKEELESTAGVPGHRGRFEIRAEGALLKTGVEVQDLHWRFLQKVYKRDLEEIQDQFGVTFTSQKDTSNGKQKICIQLDSDKYDVTGHALQAFIDLYQKVATNLIQRTLKDSKDVDRVKEAHMELERKHPNVETMQINGNLHLIGYHHHVASELEEIHKFICDDVFKELPDIGRLDHPPSKAGNGKTAHNVHSDPKMENGAGAAANSIEEDRCPICLDNFKEQYTLKCKHSFCKVCWEKTKAYSPVCPICKAVFGKVEGNQSKGYMTHTTSAAPLSGYSCRTIEITYHFPSGTQSAEHPNPGCYYTGTTRTAYLPDNEEGREVLQLLKQAFEQRLIFTIGTSRTTGTTDTVTWNDIHHKTNKHGGPERFGYPDPSYLKRVKEELKAKGIE